MVSHESEVICFLDQLNGSPEIIQTLKKKEREKGLGEKDTSVFSAE